MANHAFDEEHEMDVVPPMKPVRNSQEPKLVQARKDRRNSVSNQYLRQELNLDGDHHSDNDSNDSNDDDDTTSSDSDDDTIKVNNDEEYNDMKLNDINNGNNNDNNIGKINEFSPQAIVPNIVHKQRRFSRDVHNNSFGMSMFNNNHNNSNSKHIKSVTTFNMGGMSKAGLFKKKNNFINNNDTNNIPLKPLHRKIVSLY